MDHADYCRQLESYLCQKNGGHLIRIVGPAFEQVCGWAEQGIPLKVAYGGIDRFCDRQAARSGRRRPVRIEFCEADILALFDDWRRAVGVAAAAGKETAARKPSLASHIERVVARLVAHRRERSPAFEGLVERVLTELDQLSAASQHARGDARAGIVDRLASLDDELLAAAAAELDAHTSAAMRREAEEEVAPFGARMPSDARVRAADAAYFRLVRDSLGLPTVRYG
ncbi:MAG TPA: hypothetical protein VFJ02_08435 [Vicinamibacterales bacterium]|nr:hypothetical protein [Vicinamibacterales bacterium]